MYGSNERTELKENNSFNPGINQNVTLTAEFRSPKKDGTGDKVLCLDVKGSAGQKISITEWAVDDDDKIKNQLTRLRRWVKEVTGADTFPTSFASYEDMVKQFCETVNGKGTLLEIKLVYKEGSDKYLEMPKYDGCVRAMSNPSRLVLSASEKARCIPTTATPTDPTMMDGMDTSTTDDLPF